MNTANFKGILTALITPFKGGELDLPAFRNLVEWQIDQGICGLVPCGTTGESPTLSDDEHKKVVEACIDVAAKRVPVIVGAGSNNTAKAASLARHARDKGADGVLVVAPYYNKPTQAGLIAHYKAVSEAAALPTIVYNIPGRSIVNITPATMKELAAMPYIAGVKDATGDLTRPTTTRMDCGADFLQLSGEDATTAGFLAQGGHGAISVTSNLAPADCVALYDAWEANDMIRFAAIRDRLHPLHQALFAETSPAPVKYALSKLGFGSDELRLPLVPASGETRAMLDGLMARLNLPSPLKKAA